MRKSNWTEAGFDQRGTAGACSGDRKFLQGWLADIAVFGGRETIDLLGRNGRRAAVSRGRHCPEQIAKPAAVCQRFAPKIFVNETGGKGVAGAARIDHID